ncbi:MAG TPA: OB-fold domain-containing protein [Nocardioidaceae bacterium]|nr:OB-fold domain-containing protein [Nocardioidaceae bacterium]
MSEARDHDWIMAQAEAIKARGATARRAGRDPVNAPAIGAWLDAMGDENPIYRDTPEAQELNGGPVAPTAMAQVWTMYGLVAKRPEHDPLHNMMGVMNEAGYTSVLGTNCDQTYDRYLRVGEEVTVQSELESVVGPKQTGMGEGYFVTCTYVWRVGEEQVATMLFRVLKFKPKAAVKTLGTPIQPMVNRDSEYFWEGTEAGEVRIQKCDACGALRHPPGPMCPQCHETKRSYVVASGRGTVFSYVVHHAPQVPGKELPLRLGLVDLEEGVRMVGALKDEVEIGDAVEAVFERSGDVTLVSWRRA